LKFNFILCIVIGIIRKEDS